MYENSLLPQASQLSLTEHHLSLDRVIVGEHDSRIGGLGVETFRVQRYGIKRAKEQSVIVHLFHERRKTYGPVRSQATHD